MALKFAPNLNWLFKETTSSLRERFALAKKAGFQAVECADPFVVPLEELVTAQKENEVQLVLLNMHQGAGEDGKGMAAVPSKMSQFKESLELSIKYAKAMNCPRIHIMAGCKPTLWQDDAMEDTYRENLEYAAKRLQKEGITAVIEAISSSVIPGYFMDHGEKALSYVREINHPNLKLQMDIFHLQLTEGNLTANIKKYLPFTDHIQISQAPHRGEPDSNGEINYKYVLNLLRESDYNGYIGLEYKPAGETTDSFKWMETLL